MKDEHGTLNLVSIAQKYSDEDAARELLESLRWPEGPVCPHCQAKEVYRLTPKPTSKRPARKGVLKCKACRKQFSVTVGTVFEGSHIPLSKWLMATFLICSSKKAMSAHQLHRMLGVTYKSAWFMAHRIRHGMAQNVFAAQLRGEVAVDETFVGGKTRGQGRHFMGNKTPGVALVEKHGSVRTRVVADVTAKTLHKAIKEEVAASATIMTDQHPSYSGIGAHFAGGHHTVDHGVREYARGDVTTNTAESFFALLKRGVYGNFHHVSRKHLHRYADEFAFRWNSRKLKDGERVVSALSMIEGKRLKYRDSSAA